MPAVPRRKCKATKIIYKILGVPAPVAAKKTAKQKKVDERLIFEETSRIK